MSRSCATTLEGIPKSSIEISSESNKIQEALIWVNYVWHFVVFKLEFVAVMQSHSTKKMQSYSIRLLYFDWTSCSLLFSSKSLSKIQVNAKCSIRACSIESSWEIEFSVDQESENVR